MSVIRDKILYPKVERKAGSWQQDRDALPRDKNLAEFILDQAKESLEKNGDRIIYINADLGTLEIQYNKEMCHKQLEKNVD